MAGSPREFVQPELTLSRDARLAVLAKIDPENHPRAAGLSGAAWSHVRLICEQIELATTRDGCILHVETLATKCRLARRTFLRAASQGRHAGVLVSSPLYDERGRAASRWSVCWDRLAIWAGVVPVERGARSEERAVDTRLSALEPRPSPVALTARQLALTEHEMALTALDLALTHPFKELTNQQTSSHQPRVNSEFGQPSLAPTTPDGTAGDWRRLEDFIFSCAVDRAAECCRIARENGCSPAEIETLANHWLEHGGSQPHAAWGAAALCWRIKNARPGTPAERGWPQPSPAWLRYAASRRTAPVERRPPQPVERYAGSMLADYQAALRRPTE